MNSEYGVIGAMFVGLGAIGRFIWRWEKTFTDSAIEEVKRLRVEISELRKTIHNLEEENSSLKTHPSRGEL